MPKSRRNLFLVWCPFQRRAQTLAKVFDLDVHYYHYPWEEKGIIFKMLSYFGKFFATLRDLIRYRPKYVFIQLAPTPLLYATAMYCVVTRCRYISDCHNTMIYDGPFINWPFAKYLLRRSYILLVHNTDVQAHSDILNLPSCILRDPLPVMEVSASIEEVANIRLKETDYIIVPCSLDVDEPLSELFDAAIAVPDVRIVFTWFSDKLPMELKTKVPDNIIFTGFLEEPDFNALYANANAALVLTTREGTQPSGASEAISLGIPLVVSDIKTTRRLYEDAPIYVNNESYSISKGILTALNSHDEYSRKISSLRVGLQKDAEEQLNFVKQKIL